MPCPAPTLGSGPGVASERLAVLLHRGTDWGNFKGQIYKRQRATIEPGLREAERVAAAVRLRDSALGFVAWTEPNQPPHGGCYIQKRADFSQEAIRGRKRFGLGSASVFLLFKKSGPPLPAFRLTRPD
jgi:hypothetical protein